MLQKGPPHILVTVGTTEFDSLIEYACSEDFLEMLKRLGFQKTKITYQIGATGKFIPQNAEYFRLSNDIQAVYDSHQIIFTHGGAGTLLACLDSPNKKKKIIAVANETLAGNHQTELISKLGDQGYLLGFENVSELKKSEARVTQYLQGLLPSKEYEDSGKNLLNHVIFGQDL